MHVTPRFSLSQDESSVTVVIKLPYVRISSAELQVDGRDFSFFCQPYLLKLTFPCEFAEDADESPASYDMDNDHGTLTARLTKKNLGEHFPNLDLLASLMTVRKVRDLLPSDAVNESIEVLHSDNFVADDGDEHGELQQQESDSMANSVLAESLLPIKGYGFAELYTDVLTHLQENCAEMFETLFVHQLSLPERRWQRLCTENLRFDAARYLGDWLGAPEDPLFQSFLAYQPFWNVYYDKMLEFCKLDNPDAWFEAAGGWTSQEMDTLSSTRSTRVLPKHTSESLFLQLVDFLFAFAYEWRASEGEGSVESASNLCLLSPALHWLDSSAHSDLHAAICFSMRRLCVYPYLRHWTLGRRVLADVAKMLLCGRRVVLKALIHMKHIFEHSHTHYLFNRLFLNDWIVFLQTVVTEADLQAFAYRFNAAKRVFEQSAQQGKACMGLRLVELEAHAMQCQEGGEEVETALPDALLDCALPDGDDEGPLRYLCDSRRWCQQPLACEDVPRAPIPAPIPNPAPTSAFDPVAFPIAETRTAAPSQAPLLVARSTRRLSSTPTATAQQDAQAGEAGGGLRDVAHEA